MNQNGRITNCAALDEINKLLELKALKSQDKGRALKWDMSLIKKSAIFEK